MERQITISDKEYLELYNKAKRSDKTIDRKAYEIAKKLNKIEITIEVESCNYSGNIVVEVDGCVDKYCLLTQSYRETPKEVRDAIRRVKKILERAVDSRARSQFGRLKDLHAFQNILGRVIAGLIVIIVILILITFSK